MGHPVSFGMEGAANSRSEQEFYARFDSDAYMIDTTSGAVTKFRVGVEPHGLTVWPQPGRYSQGHTGNMR